MKRLLTITSVFAIIVMLAGCGQKAPEAPFAQDSDQYKFFKTLSDSMGITEMDPAAAKALVTTSDFTVWSYDIMPGIYAQFGRFHADLSRLPVDQLKMIIQQGAKGEAEKELLYAKAKKEGIAVTDSAVNAQLDRYFQSRGGKEKFVEFVEQQGFSLEYVTNDVRKTMNIQEFINNNLEASIEIPEEDLQEAYNSDKTASVRHILFMTQGKSAEEKAKVKENAESVLARAKKGEDFAKLAKEFTEDPGSKETGGLYENFPKGQMVKAFEDASFTLPIGSISDLVETQYGYHIIKIVDRQKETKPFDEVKAQLETQLKQGKRQEAYQTLITELKDNAKYEEHFESI